MSVVTFGGTTIVTETQDGVYSGFDHFQPGDWQDAIIQRAVPRAQDILEVDSGRRGRVHTLAVEYVTTALDTLQATLGTFRAERQYRTLVVTGWGTYTRCRMSALTFGRRTATRSATGTATTRIEVNMQFTQVG